MIASTSKAAYKQITESGKTKTQCEQIMEYLGRWDTAAQWTRREIAYILKLELGATSGRINKLVNNGSLEECGTVKCSVTNKTVGLVRLPKSEIQLELI